MKQLYFVRHGQTEFNVRNIIQGSGIDSDLNERGVAQGEAFWRYYKGRIPFEVVFTSALKRTYQTVRPFVEYDGLPCVALPELNEINWGIYEGQAPSEELTRAYNAVVEQWNAGNLAHRIQGGESAAELQTRLEAALDLLLQRPEQHLLVCTHGRTMRALVCMLRGWSLARMEEIAHSNTGLYHYEYVPPRFAERVSNSTVHLIG